MQTLRKKTSPCKSRFDPARYFGDGITFKAKLIGILEVGDARGDHMCQQALHDLKIAIRAAGEHKQRIIINICLEGLRLRDEKTGDSLYHHPVHKISFIAQDMTDARAFGYIFGSPDSGHRFFGIKTDKSAAQVVLAMRDLFQTVFELKKREIELARQHLQSKTIQGHISVGMPLRSLPYEAAQTAASYAKSHSEPTTSKYVNEKEMSPESVADLVDLEQELSSIQRGITQMDRITPSDPPAKTEEDPFGDSFTRVTAYNLLPPPESLKSRQSKTLKTSDEAKTTTSTTASNEVTTASKPIEVASFPTDNWDNDKFDDIERTQDVSKESSVPSHEQSSTGNQLTADEERMFSENSSHKLVTRTRTNYIDAFSDLDPLGTGKFRPYVDKKYFFQDLKNPPKKVLKELSDHDGSFSADFIAKMESESRKNSNETNENEFNAQFPTEAEIFSPTNIGTHGIPIASKSSNEEAIVGSNKTLSATDNDPFSPRMKKFDPFEDDFSKKSIDPFEFDFSRSSSTAKSTILPDTKIGVFDERSNSKSSTESSCVFNGPLQVNLPPENSYSSYANASRMDRQMSETTSDSIARNRPSALKQNTVDALAGIGSIKMKPLFTQKFVKRDSNMRRLQESDSFSENEAVPERPPRPDTQSHNEPPPLPPKKQFSDIVIRPRVTSPLAMSNESTKYDYLSATRACFGSTNDSLPALPVPSRRVGRTESTYPGPGRPEKRQKAEDDYLMPISMKIGEVPALQPPPPTSKSRGRQRQDSIGASKKPIQREKSNERRSAQASPLPVAAISEITLSQLLTLGIDELALRLNVPVSKLNTMTIVELTKYLSDFIERTSQKSETLSTDMTIRPAPSPPANASRNVTPHIKSTQESAIFKVSFDDSSDATFTAKFDDNFGEEFDANFDQFNTMSNSSVDKYAVFREIIEQELRPGDAQKEIDETSPENENSSDSERQNVASDTNIPPLAKINTKITEAISNAKDRYAALRDIILVEDLFDKPKSEIADMLSTDNAENIENTENADSSLSMNDGEREVDDQELRSSPEINIETNLDDAEETNKSLATPSINQPILGSKDDLEIDEYMQRAISNMSLDSRDHLSPLSATKSPINKLQNASTSPIQVQQRKSPLDDIAEVATAEEEAQATATTLNNMATSPLQLPPSEKSPQPKSPTSVKFKIPDDNASSSNGVKVSEEKAPTSNENWAVFESESPKHAAKEENALKSPRNRKPSGESPVSSDDKAEWKDERDYKKKWQRGHTSSSSRDASPWDEDGAEYRRRGGPTQPDRHGFYMRHARRMNSCDDDYEYEEEIAKRRERRAANKSAINRSRELIDSEGSNWYHPSNHRNWSPIEDDDAVERSRPFDRSYYDRSSFGPRDPKNIAYSSERYSYRGGYDKRKYYGRDYGRPGYDDEYDEYEMRAKGRKNYNDMYESSPAFGSMRAHKPAPKDYYYERSDKRSFDRESLESYDSAGRRRRSFGSGDMYGSLDSRGRIADAKERYMSAERKRSLRKTKKAQRSNEEEYDPDSDGEESVRRQPDTRSLQRTGARPRKSSGSSPWDGEELTPTGAQKPWKRPASATETEKKQTERRGGGSVLSGSDGEKEKRFYRRPRSREKDSDARYAHPRYSSATRGEEYDYDIGDYDDDDDDHYRDAKRRGGDRRRHDSDRNIENMHRISRSSRDVYFQSEKDRGGKFESFEPMSRSRPGSRRDRDRDFSYDTYEDTPHPNVTNKFNFENVDQGFESDFNIVPEKSLRFSTDFSSDKQQTNRPSTASGAESTSASSQQKLRFDDKITVSKFDLFEDDDFSKAEFAFENEDQWTGELPKKINLKNVSNTNKRQADNIKKSESVNIFSKKEDDPFADDDFFKNSSPDQRIGHEHSNNSSKNILPSNNKNTNKSNGQRNIKSAPPVTSNSSSNTFKWESNFAKFDDNI